MDLTMTQLILSRLYTDAALRKRFLANPESLVKEFGLDEHQMRELAQLSAQQLNFFADSLIRKRLGEVRKLLPLTSQALGARFGKLFWRYAESHRLTMPQPHRKDAIAFCAFLKESARSELSEVPWALDVAAFEAACLEATTPARRCILRLFRYSIRELARSLSGKASALSPARRLSLAVWFRFSRQGQLRFFTVSLARFPWPRGSQEMEPPARNVRVPGFGHDLRAREMARYESEAGMPLSGSFNR